ncbi:hypothetical protein AWB61_07170 [Chromobacterium sp. F49]|nr:hypothetical protein AWB61_07170 [Chromobacterium sp. F49]
MQRSRLACGLDRSQLASGPRAFHAEDILPHLDIHWTTVSEHRRQRLVDQRWRARAIMDGDGRSGHIFHNPHIGVQIAGTVVEQYPLSTGKLAILRAGARADERHGDALDKTAGKTIQYREGADAILNAARRRALETPVAIACITDARFIDVGDALDGGTFIERVQENRCVVAGNFEQMLDAKLPQAIQYVV